MLHELSNDKHVYAMSRDNPPALTVESGDIITLDTHDCFQGQITKEEQLLSDVNFDHINPATGPIFVTGAKPGDALKVDILCIDVADQAVTVAVPTLGLLGDRVSGSHTRVMKIKDGYAHFAQFAFPISPMIGVIGTAPANGDVPCGTPGPHGGNLDTKDVKAGATVYLPVFVNGGLLAMGDVHALQGDGEICGTGFECAAQVTVRVSVVKKAGIKIPFIENDAEIMAVGTGMDLREAAANGAAAMVDWVSNKADLSFEDAYMLASAKLDLRISQVVNPRMSVRMALQKRDLT